jgi:DNA-binding XRE family transcriptional regulator
MTDAHENQTSPEDLRSWRTQRGLTQEEAGALIGVKGQTIRSWETGKRAPGWASVEQLRLAYVELDSQRAQQLGSPSIAVAGPAVRGVGVATSDIVVIMRPPEAREDDWTSFVRVVEELQLWLRRPPPQDD